MYRPFILCIIIYWSYVIDVARFNTSTIAGQKWLKIGRFTVNQGNAKYPLSFLVNTQYSRDFITLQWTNSGLEDTDILYAYYRNLIQGKERTYAYERVRSTIYDFYMYVEPYDGIVISDLYRPVLEYSISYDWIWEFTNPSSPINLKRFLDYKTASAENINTIFTN